MEGGKGHDEVERSETARPVQQQIGHPLGGDPREGRKETGPTTPGTGGGIAETGTSGTPGPAARPAGGAKDPHVAHDIPPSARKQ